jgi:hypothetical protein
MLSVLRMRDVYLDPYFSFLDIGSKAQKAPDFDPQH